MTAASPFNFFNRKLVMLSILQKRSTIQSTFPVWVGGVGAHLEVDDSEVAIAEIAQSGDLLSLVRLGKSPVSLNGREVHESTPLQPDKDYALIAGVHPILFQYCRNAQGWLKACQRDTWRILSQQGEIMAGPVSLFLLKKWAPDCLETDPRAILSHSSTTTGFYLKDAMPLFGWERRHEPEEAAEPVRMKVAPPPLPDEPPQPDIDTDSGEFTCPACWLKFDRGDVLHVASHASLRGDPVLGEEEMLRFSATRFNNRGQALDGMGVPATEMACPHCRRKLPPSFLDLKQHIVSIVGAPSSGKSYYLSVLAKMLQNSLFTHFGTAFFDGDPKENVRLTEMKNKLFSASTPSEAMLAKTDLEGDMYLRVPRQGRTVLMPKPFVFNLAPAKGGGETVSVVFYDNAGEHFQPEADSVTSPGAQHVAAASGLLFLFDPTYNLEFRKRLTGHADPQLRDQRFDQQDTILAEMNSRIKKLRGIDFRERIDTPLAVIVGKSDVWEALAGSEPFANPLWDSALDISAIRKNSERLRELLLDVVPGIVANAETISSSVHYFPVSAFGCSPEEIGSDPKTGRKMFSPDPNKLRPQLVEMPMLWLLSNVEPSLVKVREED
jgi:hypothetical protein